MDSADVSSKGSAELTVALRELCGTVLQRSFLGGSYVESFFNFYGSIPQRKLNGIVLQHSFLKTVLQPFFWRIDSSKPHLILRSPWSTHPRNPSLYLEIRFLCLFFFFLNLTPQYSLYPTKSPICMILFTIYIQFTNTDCNCFDVTYGFFYGKTDIYGAR